MTRRSVSFVALKVLKVVFLRAPGSSPSRWSAARSSEESLPMLGKSSVRRRPKTPQSIALVAAVIVLADVVASAALSSAAHI